MLYLQFCEIEVAVSANIQLSVWSMRACRVIQWDASVGNIVCIFDLLQQGLSNP